MKSIRVKPQQGDQRAEKLHSTWGGGNLTAFQILREVKKSAKTQRERKREKKDPTSCFQLPAMWSAQRLILRLAWKCDFKAWGRGVGGEEGGEEERGKRRAG